MRLKNHSSIKLVIVAVFIVGSTFAVHLDPSAQNTIADPKVVGAPLILQPGVAGGELTTSAANAPGGFNPIFGGNQLTPLLHAGLLETNPLTLAYEPAVASAYSLSADNTSISVTLRQGIQWSDGTPLTSDDVKFTFVDLLQNQELLTSLQNFGTNIQLPEFTLDIQDQNSFTLTLPDGGADQFLTVLATQALYPRHVLGDVPPADFYQTYSVFSDIAEMVGLGAYLVASYEGNGDMNNPLVNVAVLERNPYYWKQDAAGTQLPYLDRITFRYFPGGTDLNALVASGELDLLSGGGTDNAVALSQQPGVTMQIGDPVINPDVLIFNQDAEDEDLRNLFRDERFRAAIAHTLDRQRLAGLLSENARFLAARDTAVYFRSPFYDPASIADLPFNLGHATQLLDEIGLIDTDGDGVREYPGGGKPVRFVFNTNDNNSVRVAAGEELTSIWTALGLGVEYLVEPFPALQARFDFNNRKATFDVQLIAWGLGVNTIQDANYLFCQYESSGFCHVQRFSDPEGATERQLRVDQIFAELGGSLQDAERLDLLHEPQHLISFDLGQIPLWSIRASVGYRGGIANVQAAGVFGMSFSLEYFWRN